MEVVLTSQTRKDRSKHHRREHEIRNEAVESNETLRERLTAKQPSAQQGCPVCPSSFDRNISKHQCPAFHPPCNVVPFEFYSLRFRVCCLFSCSGNPPPSSRKDRCRKRRLDLKTSELARSLPPPSVRLSRAGLLFP